MAPTTKRVATVVALAALAAFASAVGKGRLYGKIWHSGLFYEVLDEAAAYSSWWNTGNFFDPGASAPAAPFDGSSTQLMSRSSLTGSMRWEESGSSCQTMFQLMESRPELSRIRTITNPINGTLSQQLRNMLLSTGGDQFTFFLPNDDAVNTFDRLLGEGANPQWRKSTEEASALFSYHIIPVAAFFAKELSNGQYLYSGLVSSISGTVPPLLVSKQNADIIIQSVGSEAAIVTADLPVCRGVVHIIDEVLIPVDLSNSNAEASVIAQRAELGRVQGQQQEGQQVYAANAPRSFAGGSS